MSKISKHSIFIFIIIISCYSLSQCVNYGIKNCLQSCRNSYEYCKKKNRSSIVKLQECETEYARCKDACMTSKNQKKLTDDYRRRHMDIKRRKR